MARTGRPLAMPVEDRKETIYAAAERLFGERGFDKVTMSEVAEAAGMSKRTLYQHFADKAALLSDLVSSSYVWPDETPDDTGDSLAELRQRLRVIADHVLSERHINLCRLAIGESVGMQGLANTFYDRAVDRSRKSLIRTLSRIEPAKKRVDLPPATLAGMLYGTTCGHRLMTALLTGKKPDLKAAYRTIDEVIAELFVR